MRKLVLLAVALLVSGCAEYNFTPMAGRLPGMGDERTDLKNCQDQAIARYFADPGVRARMILAGSLGGRTPPPDMNANIELCMHMKGYNGSIN